MKSLSLLPLAASTYLTGPKHAARFPHRHPSLVGRLARAFREFNADNVELWDRYLRNVRPWVKG